MDDANNNESSRIAGIPEMDLPADREVPASGDAHGLYAQFGFKPPG